jgi:3-dehydroquinate synthase
MTVSAFKTENAEPVRVELGERSYDIRFYRDRTDALAADIAPFCPEKALIVSNETIWNAHGTALLDSLTKAGVDSFVALIGDGERHKTLESTSAIYDVLIQKRYGRKTCIIAFGGGVVGDLAGFVAATFLRGVDFIQIPTTVVAMVDSSVGGKTGVDHPLGKNLIGSFHQPRLVAIDPSYLKSLDEFNIAGGFAEVIKYGVIYDAEFFSFLEERIADAMKLEQLPLEHIIRTSCAIKAAVVGSDERESGLRAILNYGHTFGHAIESIGEYRERQFHGQAVAIGMCCANDLAVRKGMLDKASADRIEQLIIKAGLPNRIPSGILPDDVWDRMHTDKKATAGKLRFILPHKIGKVGLHGDIPKDDVISAITGRIG